MHGFQGRQSEINLPEVAVPHNIASTFPDAEKAVR